jgi:hypothetical protein
MNIILMLLMMLDTSPRDGYLNYKQAGLNNWYYGSDGYTTLENGQLHVLNLSGSDWTIWGYDQNGGLASQHYVRPGDEGYFAGSYLPHTYWGFCRGTPRWIAVTASTTTCTY